MVSVLYCYVYIQTLQYKYDDSRKLSRNIYDDSWELPREKYGDSWKLSRKDKDFQLKCIRLQSILLIKKRKKDKKKLKLKIKKNLKNLKFFFLLLSVLILT